MLVNSAVKFHLAPICFWLLILFYPALIALGGSVWLCVPLGHYTREALHQGTHVCPPPCAQMAGHKAILWQPHLVDRARGPCPLKESLRRFASLSGS